MFIRFAIVFLLGLGWSWSSDQPTDKQAIHQVIEWFVLSGDHQDPNLAEKALHQNFAQYLDLGRGVMRTDKQAYQEALKKKVIGGEARKFQIKNLDITGKTAYAKLIMDSSKIVFTDYVTLMKTDNRWQIVSIALSVKPKR